MALNLRGVKESVMVLLPIFLLFLVTHVIVLIGGIFGRAAAIADTARAAADGFHAGLAAPGFGIGAMALLFLHAYSLGGGTYTGIEAVSNGMPIMREPRVETGKRTMLYMATSLAFTAGGLLVCYLLWGVQRRRGQDDERGAGREARRRAAVRRRLRDRDAGLRGRRCWSWRRRPASSTGRGCWPTWPSTPGCRTASPPSPSG